MGVRRWRKQCEERAEWKKITEKAKTHSASKRRRRINVPVPYNVANFVAN
jgi:hypothetical protein